MSLYRDELLYHLYGFSNRGWTLVFGRLNMTDVPLGEKYYHLPCCWQDAFCKDTYCEGVCVRHISFTDVGHIILFFGSDGNNEINDFLFDYSGSFSGQYFVG